MICYYARSIRGGHNTQNQYANKLILDTIKELGHTPALDLPVAIGKQHNTDRYIYLRDLAWIRLSQAVIADVSNPSLGVGYEIAYAVHARGLPVLCVAREGVKVSAMIAGEHKIFFYTGTETLKAILVSQLEKIKP